MTHGSHYLGKLYNDLIANSPQTISIDIPSDMGKGRIAQTQIKHGIIFSDWQMCYQSDMNVQGTVSKDYMQIIFCLNGRKLWYHCLVSSFWSDCFLLTRPKSAKSFCGGYDDDLIPEFQLSL